LQLILSDGVHSTNTLVMANLGYYQLKANPGLWSYSIRSGRSSEVFELEEIEGSGAAGPTVDGQAYQILLTTFEGVTIFPKFGRKPGMEEVDLLDDDAEKAPINVKHKAAEALSGLKNR
jgi:UDP-glucose:glycoprotein glucosyltransferase